MPRGVYDRTGKPAPFAKKTAIPPTVAEEKILSETTSDNPSYAKSVPTPPTEGQAMMTEAFVADPKTGRYTKQTVPVGVLVEPPDHFAHDPMGLGPDWDKTRGTEMHARWANANPKYRVLENQYHYLPVDPAEVPDDVRKRFFAAEVDGYDGPCLVHGDAVLVECPNWKVNVRESRRAKARDAKNQELWGIGGALDGDGPEGSHRLTANLQVGGHIDDVDAGPRGQKHSGESYNEMMAQAEVEAEYESRSGARMAFGGFQGNDRYNKTSWSRDQR